LVKSVKKKVLTNRQQRAKMKIRAEGTKRESYERSDMDFEK